MIYLPEKLFDRYWKKMTGLSVLKGLLTTEAPINLATLQKLFPPLNTFLPSSDVLLNAWRPA